jgi:hypothetical protein
VDITKSVIAELWKRYKLKPTIKKGVIFFNGKNITPFCKTYFEKNIKNCKILVIDDKVYMSDKDV